MLVTTASREPRPVRRYFDRRGWADEPRSHAEVAQVYRPVEGWSVCVGRKRVSYSWLKTAYDEGVTAICVRVRYSDRRTVTADFSVEELLKGEK